MSEAKKYLKRVGLLQSPYISQERVIKHLEAFANEQVQKQLHIHGVVVRSEQLNNGAEFTYHEWIRYNFKEIDKNTYIQKGDHRHLVKYTERELRGKFARSKRVV